MSKFKRVSRCDLFNLIIVHICDSCGKMREDCLKTGNHLPNHEDKISNRLVENYLDINSFELVFILQKPENFNATSDTFVGRTDISVISSDRLKNRNAYLTIECKRIDGKKALNKKYVEDGLARFVVPPLKYSSYYGKSIMLGYVVTALGNVSENTKKIDEIQREMLVGIEIGEMQLMHEDGKGFSHHQCTYKVNGLVDIELAHLFYDFSNAMEKVDA